MLVWFVPDAVLTSLVERRQREIRNTLPQAIDLMVLCVDAGLGLDAALQKVAVDSTGLSGALNDELSILSREIFLGVDRERAYLDLYSRTGVDELKTLASAPQSSQQVGSQRRTYIASTKRVHSQKTKSNCRNQSLEDAGLYGISTLVFHHAFINAAGALVRL